MGVLPTPILGKDEVTPCHKPLTNPFFNMIAKPYNNHWIRTGSQPH